MLYIRTVVERLASLAVEALPCPSPDVAIELNVGRIELLFAGPKESVQALDQPATSWR